MVGTVVITESIWGSVKSIKVVWTSTGGGAASDTTTEYYNGEVIRLVTVPGTGGDIPSDNYGVVALDSDGIDVLNSQGLLRDDTNTEQVLAANLGCVANSKLTFTVSAAGAANKGTIYLYIR